MKTNTKTPVGYQQSMSVFRLAGTILLLCACDPELESDLVSEDVEIVERAGNIVPDAFNHQHDLDQGYFSVRTGFAGETDPVAECRSTQWSAMSGQSISFVTPASTNQIAIGLSGDFSVAKQGEVMHVRALVDGEEVGKDGVQLIRSTESKTHSFVFGSEVGPGIHTVQLQCRVSHETAVGTFKNTALKVTQGSPSGELDIHTDDTLVSLDKTTWTDVPDAAVEVLAKQGDLVSATVALEYWGPGNLELRAVRDGAVMSPGAVVFAASSQQQGQSATFVDSKSVAKGEHEIKLQYRVTGKVYVTQKTFYGESRPRKQAGSRGREAVCTATHSKATATWEPLLSSSVDVPAGAELAFELSGESLQADSGSIIHTRLVVDGTPMMPTERVFKSSDSSAAGIHQLFDAKYFKQIPDANATDISLEWYVEGGSATIANPCGLFDYELEVFPWLAQDYFLTDELNVAKTNITTPATGVIPRVVIIRHNMFENETDRTLTGEEMISMFTRENGVIDYFEEISQGKFTIDPDGIEVWPDPEQYPEKYYTSADANDADVPHPAPFNFLFAEGGNPGILDKEDFRYYNTFDNDCEEGWGPYKMAGDMARYYALKTADRDGLDLEGYDVNNDGVLQEDEVLFVFWEPKVSLANMRWLNNRFCNGSTLSIDGKTMRREINYGHDGVDSDGQVAVVAHEIHHALFGSQDLYSNADPSTVRPGRFALMDVGYGGVASHLGAPHKVRHGWVTPRLARYNGTYELDDVKESREVIYLPRWDVRGSEAYVIEVRKSELTNNGTNFDQNLPGSGLAIWHIINDRTEAGRDARDTPWACNSEEVWGDLKRDLKLNRMITPGNQCTKWGDKLWNEGDGDILDDPILVCAEDCSAQAGDQSLLWADGTASGYQIKNISAAGETMTFDLVAPTCQDRCGSYDASKTCQCDEVCEQFGDCCNDVEYLCE